jgi:hypothetical protein
VVEFRGGGCIAIRVVLAPGHVHLPVLQDRRGVQLPGGVQAAGVGEGSSGWVIELCA